MKITQKKILVIRLSSLGDILLTTPVLRAIKNLYPKVQIDYLIRSGYTDAIKFNPAVDNLILFEDFTNSDLIYELRQNNYDMVIDLQNNFRSKRICWFLNKKRVVYKKPNLKKFLLVKLKLNLFKNIIPIPERYAGAVPELNLDNRGPELIVPKNIESEIDGGNLIGFCPGAKHFTKMWPEKYFINLGNSLTRNGYRIVIFGGESDIEICNKIASKIDNSVNMVNTNNLLRTAANMKMCKLIVCNDSGLMHTAASVNIPIIAIFGSTVKEFGFSPYNSANIVLENNSLSCRPCSHIGRENCPKSHFNCMKSITPDFVKENIQKFIREL